MANQTKSAQEHSAAFTSKQRTIALVVVALAFVMDLLDGTIVNVAIPTIQANLHATYSTIQWLIAGYSLTFALLLITGGRMGDVFGYKKIFMIGVGGFTLASLLSGVAVSPAMLIFARLLQGSMAALMVPQVMSLMQVMYKPEERAVVNGLFGGLGGLAASLGPVIGGLLIKANVAGLDWRPIFLINVPVGIAGLFAAQKYLPNGKSPHPLKLDLIGTGLVLIAMTCLVYPLIQGRELGWPAWTFVLMAASIPFFGAFAQWQRMKVVKDGSPLVVPSLFKQGSFTAGLLVNLLFEAAMLGFFLTFTLWLQIGAGFSAIHAALTGLPIAIAIAVVMGAFGESIIPKLGRNALALGTVLMALGLCIVYYTLHHYGLGVHSWQLIPGLLLVGSGMGCVFGSLFAVVLNGVDARHAGAASGILNAVQQVGGAIGIAVIGVIFFGQLGHAAPNSFASVQPEISRALVAAHVPSNQQQNILTSVKNCFVDRSREKDPSIVPQSCTQSNQNDALGNTIALSAKKANVANFSAAFKAGVIYEILVLISVFILSRTLPKKFRSEAFKEI